MITNEQAAEIRALLAKATPGVWEHDDDEAGRINGLKRSFVAQCGGVADEWINNSALIVAMHAATPALLDERDALRAALAKIDALASAAVAQRAPSDDKIIAEHIEAVRDVARAALKRAAPAPAQSGEG